MTCAIVSFMVSRMRERKLQHLADALAAYEAEHGTLTDGEIEEQRRADRRNARIVRSAV